MFFWTLYWFLFLLFVLLKSPESLDESNRHLKNQLTITLVPPFLIGMIFAAVTQFPFLELPKYNPQTIANISDNQFLKYTAMSTVGLILGLFVSIIYLLKINDKDLKNLVIEEKRNIIKYDSRKIKKYFLLAFILIIILGSMIELQRGMWVMWIETILLFFLMSLIIWKIYKHVFYVEEKL